MNEWGDWIGLVSVSPSRADGLGDDATCTHVRVRVRVYHLFFPRSQHYRTRQVVVVQGGGGGRPWVLPFSNPVAPAKLGLRGPCRAAYRSACACACAQYVRCRVATAGAALFLRVAVIFLDLDFLQWAAAPQDVTRQRAQPPPLFLVSLL